MCGRFFNDVFMGGKIPRSRVSVKDDVRRKYGEIVHSTESTDTEVAPGEDINDTPIGGNEGAPQRDNPPVQDGVERVRRTRGRGVGKKKPKAPVSQ